MQTYMLDEVIVYLDAVPITEFADGDAFSFAYDGPDWNKHKGSHGANARSAQNNTTGTGSLRIIQTSTTNEYLQTKRDLDVKGPTRGNHTMDLMVKDLRGNTVITGTCWIEKTADAGFANDVGQREWPLGLADLDIKHGGTLDL